MLKHRIFPKGLAKEPPMMMDIPKVLDSIEFTVLYFQLQIQFSIPHAFQKVFDLCADFSLIQDRSGKQNNKQYLFTDSCPTPGPGRRPLDWCCRDIEFADMFASVASLTVFFMSKCIFWNPVGK